MKTKKYLKIASLAVVAAIFIWTFVFLYRKSRIDEEYRIFFFITLAASKE